MIDVNVHGFGATGDGITDDSRAFRLAVKAVIEAGGGTIHVPEGRYRTEGDKPSQE